MKLCLFTFNLGILYSCILPLAIVDPIFPYDLMALANSSALRMRSVESRLVGVREEMKRLGSFSTFCVVTWSMWSNINISDILHFAVQE